jgi:hypothetical protein
VDHGGQALEVERTQPVHAVILIPELDLLRGNPEFGSDLLREFCKQTGGFLHILDPSELLRVVQSAGQIASLGKATTIMMAFDSYLMERANKVVEVGHLCLEVLLRMENPRTDDMIPDGRF